MDRKRRLPCKILICLILSSCIDIGQKVQVDIMVEEGTPATRAELPEENRISDISVLIFDSNGTLEYRAYSRNHGIFQATLLKGERYTAYAFINFGYAVICESESQLENLEHYLSYPDEYRSGIPMSAKSRIVVQDDSDITLEAVRLMSRISIRMDRSRLSDGVDMKVEAIRIGNCPKRVEVLKESRVRNEDDCFVTGFSHRGPECAPLNTENSGRISDEVSLYMLENMQGAFQEGSISTDSEKHFEEYDKRSRTCSFIEMEIGYSSAIWTSSDAPLKYRFYLGESLNDLNIERNCHYHITVCPEDDGLHEDGWRVDKTGLKYTGKTSLEKYPSDYIVGDIGDKIHLGCILTPGHAPFDIGLDYLEEDKKEGIYDYKVDPDGHGVTLTLTGPGRGLIYMEAGDPINDAALFIIEVNLP